MSTFLSIISTHIPQVRIYRMNLYFGQEWIFILLHDSFLLRLSGVVNVDDGYAVLNPLYGRGEILVSVNFRIIGKKKQGFGGEACELELKMNIFPVCKDPLKICFFFALAAKSPVTLLSPLVIFNCDNNA